MFYILILSLSVQMITAQDTGKLFGAIGKGDAKTLGNYFVNDMELTIGNSQDFYSKAEAISRIGRFFNEVKPISCSFLHQGNSRDNSSHYYVGVLKSEKGQYRVFLYFEGNQINSVMFNKE